MKGERKTGVFRFISKTVQDTAIVKMKDVH